MKKTLLLLNLILTSLTLFSQDKLDLPLLKNEKWWGGSSNYGHMMPFSSKPNTFNLYGDKSVNQSVPLFISNYGRWIWSDEPFEYSFHGDTLTISKAHAEIKHGKAGNSLSEAYRYTSKTFFPSSGKWPDSLLVKAPQYNLWIELAYNPNQADVLNYADKVLQNGFPAGVLMIDDNWGNYYGDFEFNKAKFPDPAAAIKKLHDKGFKVMLWLSPFISPDSETFRELAKRKLLLMDNGGDINMKWGDKKAKPLITYWWNGFSATLDLSNPDAQAWLKGRLNYMKDKYGIDGYKFDAGEPHYYDNPNLLSFKKSSPNDHTIYWAQIGLDYPLNEYRAMWKMAGQPLGQRLNDKGHSWKELQTLVPNSIAQQLMGYTFTCPDLIGGGFLSTFASGKIDQKLMVRSTQVHALMPMMQFSAGPWRVLDSVHLRAVKKAVDLRQKYVPQIMDVLAYAAKTGEPALKPLEYDYPNQGYANVQDQFLLGNKIMVAPVVTFDDTREVFVPKGKWKFRNEVIKGPLKLTIKSVLDELPLFEKVN